MKGRLFFVSFVLFIGLFMGGCASNNFVYDRSIGEESICLLKIPDDFTVVKFDGKNVKWKTSVWGLNITQKKKVATVKIPAGEHKLIVNYLQRTNLGTYTRISRADGIELSFDFQPGNAYSLLPIILGDRITLIIRKE
ncbi:MAG: hypothetical protein LBI28_09815 [Treponema sp.]|jgi:hypothetical protein|nr:hypothetical protein [Treponema sp.]